MLIIITGASKGIGSSLMKKFTQDGYDVVGTYNSTKPDGDNYYQVDIQSYDQVCQWVEQLLPRLKDVVLINCAGISYNSFAHKADIEKWSSVIDVNIKGTFNVIRALLPHMRNDGYGRIVNFSSVVTKLPTPGVSAYAASKAALVGLTKSLATENASKGITVNAINLGYCNVGMGVNDVPAEYQEKMMSQIPSKRFCDPQEIYNTIRYMIDTPYLNGSAIDINGAII